MQITPATDKNQWNKFIADNSSLASFLQSWEWGEFQRSLGNKIYRIAIADDEHMWKIATQIIIKNLPLGKTYLDAPKGPVVTPSANNQLPKLFIEESIRIGKTENALLFRISPPYETILNTADFSLQTPKILIHQKDPEDSLLVDLTKTEDELLTNMHEKLRYNIGLSGRKGIAIKVANGHEPTFVKFLELTRQTAARDGIKMWPNKRFKKFYEVFLQATASQLNDKEFCAKLFVAEFENKILAAAIIVFFGNTATYLYGASANELRNLHAPSLLLWETMRYAKRVGKTIYDLWGIAPQEAEPKHPWQGITTFKSRYVKLGVTGREIHYGRTRDLVLDKTYHGLFKLAKTVKNFF